MNIFNLNQEEHLAQYDREAFAFKHNVSDHPLLQLDSLSRMVLGLPQEQVYFSSGKLDINDDFDNAHRNKPSGKSLEETLQNLDQAGAYIMVRQPDIDPEYQPLLQQMLNEVLAFKKSKDPGIVSAQLYLFIASPYSKTPFHVDRYQTLLTQLSGSKTIKVWRPQDREAVTSLELDSLFAWDKTQEPKFKTGTEAKAQSFVMNPGDALHIPFAAAHTVDSGPEVSVGLSIIFTTAQSERRAAAHRFNYGSRRCFKHEPIPVDKIAWLDACKAKLVRVIERMKGK